MPDLGKARQITAFTDSCGEPFFHFSGFDPIRPQLISKHQDRLRMSDLGADGERLFQEYAESLLNAGYATCIRWSYGNSRFAK